ncbi:STAS domain-containing protein [Streptomyces sp. NPDC023588]|uniref:STAS domain-containing protein n=1 Tax=Streptomyces sp. NPDC023588 TaxID=3154907 RepID=UPI0033F94C8E
MITTQVQHCGGSVLVRVGGELDEEAGAVLQQALDDIAIDARDLMVDLHGVVSMDSGGLLHLLELHRRAECLGLRVLVIGWQPQPPAAHGPGRRDPRAGFGYRGAVRAGGLPPADRATRTGCSAQRGLRCRNAEPFYRAG